MGQPLPVIQERLEEQSEEMNSLRNVSPLMRVTQFFLDIEERRQMIKYARASLEKEQTRELVFF
jgi:uncharacterized protein YbcI